LLPLLFGGFTADALVTYWGVPFIFALGIAPLCAGSAFWMSPFLFGAVQKRCGPPVYRAWVAGGAFVAVFAYTDLQFTGDAGPEGVRFFFPSIAAFIISLSVCWATGSGPLQQSDRRANVGGHRSRREDA
jgi:hypothetical protein